MNKKAKKEKLISFHYNGDFYEFPSETVEACYRFQERVYRTQDLLNHIDSLIETEEISEKVGNKIKNDKSEIYNLVVEFLENYDCNLSENDQFEQSILNCAKNYQ